MNLSSLEACLFAYYIQGAAGDLAVAPRFYPHGELVLIIEDKVAVAARRFGFKVKSAAKPVATEFVVRMIAAGGWSSTANSFGGTMHQFQGDAYKAVLAQMQTANAIVQSAQAAGDGFWETRFAELTS